MNLVHRLLGFNVFYVLCSHHSSIVVIMTRTRYLSSFFRKKSHIILCFTIFALSLLPQREHSNNKLNRRKVMGLIGSIIIGCLAGFCAGKLMKGGGFGFIMNLVLGLFGGLVGGWLFGQLGITWGGILGQLGTAIIGAVAILWVASLIKK